MNRVLIASAISLVIVSGCGVGSVATPTSEPTASPAASPTSAPSPGVTAAPTTTPPATAVVSTPHDGMPGITITLAASGWTVDEEGHPVKGTDVNGVPEATMLLWSFKPGTAFHVWGNPCRSESTQPETPATTVDEFAAALAAQAFRDASEVTDATIGGYAGKSVTLHVPDDAMFDDCEGGTFATYGTTEDPGARTQQGPGQIDQLWILDVGGSIVVIDAMYRQDTPQEFVEEMRSIAESVAFDMPYRTHFLADGSRGGLAITITLPTAGWSGERDEWHVEGPGGFDPPAGAGIISFTVDEEFYVYGDPCNWQGTRPDSPATTVEEIVAALAGQASRNPSAPERITTKDGHEGQRITLHMPETLLFSDCDDGKFATLGVAGEDPGLWAQGPGEIDELWIVEVDGRIALLEGVYYVRTPQNVLDDLHAILDSATFD